MHALLFLWNRIGREPTAYAKVLGAPSEKVELGTARTTNCYLHLKGLHLHLLSATGKQHVLLFCPTHLTDCSHSYKGNMTLCPCLLACLPANPFSSNCLRICCPFPLAGCIKDRCHHAPTTSSSYFFL